MRWSKPEVFVAEAAKENEVLGNLMVRAAQSLIWLQDQAFTDLFVSLLVVSSCLDLSNVVSLNSLF